MSDPIDVAWFHPIRMLIVCDGDGGLDISFGPPPPNDEWFSLSHLLSVFQFPLSLDFYDVTLAHRGIDPGMAEGVQNHYRFGEDLSQYDEIWLFGVASRTMTDHADALSASELDAITHFMQAGGGVFATGDHASLGGRMCQRIPRVRSMRNWYFDGDGTVVSPPGPNGEPPGPPPLGPNRLDTTRPRPHIGASTNDPGPTAVWFADQSDDIPQQLSFRPPAGAVPPGDWPDLSHHPLLHGRTGRIDRFPDHMHEGEVVFPPIPGALSVDAATGAPVAGSGDEYPSYGAFRPLPGIVAWATAGGYSNHVQPFYGSIHFGRPDAVGNARVFGAVGAYDGQWVRVGRVAVDSTLHHFVDINLTGDPYAQDPIKRQGFTGSQDGLAVLEGMDDYYRNIAHWLVPGSARFKLLIIILDVARFAHPLDEVVPHRFPTPPGPVEINELGELTFAALGRARSREMVTDMLAAGLPAEMRHLLDPAAPTDPSPIPVADAARILLGSVLVALVDGFPDGLAGSEEDTVLDCVDRGLQGGLTLLADVSRDQATRHAAADSQMRTSVDAIGARRRG